MASFDPSIISQIPDYAGNPLESRAKAYKLADYMTEEQRNKLMLQSQKQTLEDDQKARDIFKKNADSIGTPEGNIKLSRAYAKEGLSRQAMESLQFGSEQQTRELQQQELKNRILQQYVDNVGPAALQVKNTLQNQGLAAAQAEYARLLPTMPKELSQKWPPQLPNDPQQAGQLLETAIGVSEKAQKQLAASRAERAEETKERHEREIEREDRARDARAEKAASGKPPAGFEWDPDHPDTLRPIAGGPKDPNSKPWTGREKVFGERIITSANEASRAIKNITELPVGASTGVLGVGSSPGHSIYQATRDGLRNKMSSQEVQDYNTMLAGVRRNLATIESAGLAPPGSLTESMSSIELREGDSQMTKLRKLAEMRQIVDAGLEVQLADPAIPDSIKDVARRAQGAIHEAVPFSHSDITRLQANPKETLQQLIDKKGLSQGTVSRAFSDPDKEKRYQEWKKKQGASGG